MFGFFRRRRRRKLRTTPLPAEWWAIIDRNVPLIADMPAGDRVELGGIVQVLLAEKSFEGCGGLTITDEIRVTIAAQAAVLLLHRETDYYPTLRTILVYPRAFVAPATQRREDGSLSEGPQARSGESWFRGALVLSWDDVVQGAADDDDGHNVTLHEFAHQLDGESGAMNGAPQLPSRGRYRDWARVLGAEFSELVNRVHTGHGALLDAYASTNPAEFFAVATELYFERPAAMQRHYPELFAELAEFYAPEPKAS